MKKNFEALHFLESEGQNIMYSIDDYLAHYQIMGAKHGVRRFQNLDGSLTPEGRIRYGVGAPREKKKFDERASEKVGEEAKNSISKTINSSKSKIDAIKEDFKKKKNERDLRRIEEDKKRKEVAEKKKAEEAEVERLQKEAEHEKLLKDLRNKPEDAIKYKEQLTDADYERLKKEIEFDKKLTAFKQDKIDQGWKLVQTIANNSESIVKLAGNAAKIYNILAGTNNMMVESGALKKGKILKEINYNLPGNNNNNSNNNQNNNKKNGKVSLPGNNPSKEQKQDFKSKFENAYKNASKEERDKFHNTLDQMENNKKQKGTWTNQDEAYKRIVDSLSIKILNEKLSNIK